jgi:hypothetical protein
MATPVLICMFLPPSTHDLLPFHHHLSIVCAELHTTALCVCLSLTHTYNSLSSSGISYHIHRVCFPKAHVVVPVMDIPKYLTFSSYMRGELSHSCMVVCPPSPMFSFVECLFNHGPVLCSQGTGTFSPEFVRQDIWNHFAKGSQNNEFAASVSISFCPISTITTSQMKQSCWTWKSIPSFFSCFTHMRTQIFLFCSFFLKSFYKYTRTPIFLIFSSFFNFLHILRTQILVSFLSCMP